MMDRVSALVVSSGLTVLALILEFFQHIRPKIKPIAGYIKGMEIA
jgi:hypothetical protein